jgi:Subtilase family
MPRKSQQTKNKTMKATGKIVGRLMVGCVFACCLISKLHAQPMPPINTNAPPHSGTNTFDYTAYYSNNLASVSQWLHDGYTLPDGTPADFQTIMDNAATALSDNADSMAGVQESALDAAWTTAINTGVPTIVTNADGTISALVDYQDGVFLYNRGLNVEAAQTIGTVKVWPGGSTGFNLNGTNRVIGQWDEGIPRLTHEEFVSTRVTNWDGSTFTSDNHATAVAGTLVAGGYYNLYVGTPPNNLTNIGPVTGMSFGATVQSSDFFFDTSEMMFAVGTSRMRLSNHSYGRTTGWYQDATNGWNWAGVSQISTNQDPKFGLYSTTSSNLDYIIYSAPTYLNVWAAGNSVSNGPPKEPTNHWEFNLAGQHIWTNTVHPLDGGGSLGGYDTILEQGAAKDVLTIGAVFTLTNGYAGTNSVVWAPFSSCGPTDDGRIKPDVVADGVGINTTWGTADNAYYLGISGTSFSTPSVVGSINLLAQFYSQLHTNSADLLASTFKALVIHTADQCGGAPGPSYKFGWGLMDTASAATLINQDATNGLKNFIKEILLVNGTYIRFPITAVGGTNNPLKVTIVWTDPPATANAETNLNNPTPKLINDLDLRVYSPSGTTNFPWVLNPDLTNQTVAARSAAATTGDDSRNPVEQVLIANPITNGIYMITVTNKGTLSGGSQWVSMLISGNVAQPPPPLKINQILQTGINSMAVGWPSVVGQRYQAQYVDALNSVSNNWQNIGAQVSARLTNVVTQLPMNTNGNTRFYRLVQVP